MKIIREYLDRYYAWRSQRKVKKAFRTAESIADTTAAGIGAILRLSVRAVATVLLVVITTGLLLTCIFAVYVKTCMTEDLDISLEEAALSLSSTIWYQDSDGSWREMTKLYSQENRTWVDYENIPLELQHAAVAIEDKRFYDHKGVDWYRTVAAFANMFLSMNNTFGGSTLTQQLIKNLTEYDDVTVQRKLMEIFRALEFEKKYTKDEIMTWYLNEIYLGEGCYGVNSAANCYFGKNVWDLDLAECAALIGITNNPSLYDPYIYPENCTKRRNTTLRQMYEQGYIEYDEYAAAISVSLEDTLNHNEDVNSSANIYTWYEEVILDDAMQDLAACKGVSNAVAEKLVFSGGYNIYACVDMRIQNIVDDFYQNLYNLPSSYRSSSQQLRSAMVIIEPTTGDIVALAGDVGEKTINLGFNLATKAKRPPGSSFKPLAVYSPAIDTGIINQNTTFNDSPGLTLQGTSWFPHNSGGYSGVITVHNALVASKNTVAAQILDTIGLATSWDYLTNHYGITSLVRDRVTDDGRTVTDYAYAPLALGQLSDGITVREMAQAYTAFVNEGKMSYGRTYSVITDPDGNLVYENTTRHINSISANTAANMLEMMQDAVYRGTGTEAYLRNTAVAGKTGTTDDDKDRYFCGVTMYYVAAVWTGYETPERMYFSGNPACQIFRKIMSQVLDGYEYWSFPTGYINSASLDSAGAAAEYEEEEEDTEAPEPTDYAAPTPFSPSTPAPTECAHNWIEQTTTIHHDAVTEQRWVDTSYTDPITYVCNNGDFSGTSLSECENHLADSDHADAGYSTSGGEYHEEGHFETVTVSEAWDEAVGTGRFVCSKCGTTR